MCVCVCVWLYKWIISKYQIEPNQTKRNLINIHYRWNFYCKYCQSCWSKRVQKKMWNGSDSNSSNSSSGQIIKATSEEEEEEKNQTRKRCYVRLTICISLQNKVRDTLISISHIHRWIIPEFQPKKKQTHHLSCWTHTVWRAQELFQSILIFSCLLFCSSSCCVSVNLSGSHLLLYLCSIITRSRFMLLLLLLLSFQIPFSFASFNLDDLLIFSQLTIPKHNKYSPTFITKRKCVCAYFFLFYFIMYTHYYRTYTYREKKHK